MVKFGFTWEVAGRRRPFRLFTNGREFDRGIGLSEYLLLAYRILLQIVPIEDKFDIKVVFSLKGANQAS